MSTKMTTDDAVDAVNGRKAPKINPADCKVNYDGNVFKELFCRLPATFVADDIKEGSIWQNVQSAPGKSLRKLDRVVLVNHDESAMWTAYVAEANGVMATLSTPAKHDLKARMTQMFEDDIYRVIWTGAQYQVQRKSDQFVFQDSGHATWQGAQAYLFKLYPKVA